MAMSVTAPCNTIPMIAPSEAVLLHHHGETIATVTAVLVETWEGPIGTSLELNFKATWAIWNASQLACRELEVMPRTSQFPRGILSKKKEKGRQIAT